jgi:hypothetical protein
LMIVEMERLPQAPFCWRGLRGGVSGQTVGYLLESI